MALELDPRSGARMTTVFASQKLGDLARADREMARVVQNRGSAGPSAISTARFHAQLGNTAEARELLADMVGRSRHEYVPKDQIAAVYVALGDTAQALRWLETAVNERHWWMFFWNSDPFAESLRSNPQFQRLLARMGAPS